MTRWWWRRGAQSHSVCRQKWQSEVLIVALSTGGRSSHPRTINHEVRGGERGLLGQNHICMKAICSTRSLIRKEAHFDSYGVLIGSARGYFFCVVDPREADTLLISPFQTKFTVNTHTWTQALIKSDH